MNQTAELSEKSRKLCSYTYSLLYVRGNGLLGKKTDSFGGLLFMALGRAWADAFLPLKDE